jgi:hypothetical protein
VPDGGLWISYSRGPTSFLKEGRISTYPESAGADGATTEPFLIFGEIVRDVGVMKDMLTGLAFSGQVEYRRNVRVARSAAERIIKRADRLIGDEPA